jgi:tetratricopeptide (TPR) repeat protein
LSYSRQALSIRRDIGDRNGQAQSLDHVAILLAHIGKYQEAENCREEALKICVDTRDTRIQMMILNNMGDLKLRLGKTADALEYYTRAASIVSEMGRQHKAIWLCNIASIWQRAGRYEEALSNYRKALQTHRIIGDRRSEIETLIDIGSTLTRIGRNNEAIEHHQQALAISLDIADLRARALRCTGDTLSRSGDHAAARDYYQQAHDLARLLGDPFEEAKALEGIGLTLLRTQRQADAQRPLKQALRIYRRLGTPDVHTVKSYLQGSNGIAG